MTTIATTVNTGVRIESSVVDGIVQATLRRTSVAASVTGARPRGLGRATPASLLADGDSYVAATGLTDVDDGFVQRVAEAFGLGPGHVANLGVSGSPLRTTYYRTWQYLGTHRAAAPYTPDVACYLGKWATNDAIRGTSAAQEYGFKQAMRGLLAHVQAGSVYDYDDATVAVDASWAALLWDDLDAEPYDRVAHSSARPWGSGDGCWRSSTIGAVATVTVPDDHTGTVDLYFVGGPYGGTATIEVDGEAHGTVTTSGCGAVSFVVTMADERVGLVYRIADLEADQAHTVTVTVESVQAGTVNNPGEIRFDHWTMKAEESPLILFGDCPEIPDIPVVGGLWNAVTPAVCTTYTGWIVDVVDEFNGAGDLTYPVARVPLQAASTHAGNPGAAGHPNALGSAVYAALILDTYKNAAWPSTAVLYNGSWTTDDYGPEGPPGTRGASVFTGDGPPSATAYNFTDDPDNPATVGADWVNVAGTAGILSGAAYLAASVGNGFTKQRVTNETLMNDGQVTAILGAGAVQNNAGLILRWIDSSNYATLVVAGASWLLRHVVAGVTTSRTIVGPHVTGTVVRAEFVGDQWTFSFNGSPSTTGTVTYTGLETGTRHGFEWPHSGATTWTNFSYGAPTAIDGDLWIDVANQAIYGPVVGGDWGAPRSFQLSAAAALARLSTVDGAGSGLDADLLDGQHGAYYATATDLGLLSPAAAFAANTSGIADDSATFGGYTIGQIAAALIAADILA